MWPTVLVPPRPARGQRGRERGGGRGAAGGARGALKPCPLRSCACPSRPGCRPEAGPGSRRYPRTGATNGSRERPRGLVARSGCGCGAVVFTERLPRESVGTEGEQGTVCRRRWLLPVVPWEPCDRAGGHLSCERWGSGPTWPARRDRLPCSSPSLCRTLSGWELLRTGPPLRRWRLPLDLILLSSGGGLGVLVEPRGLLPSPPLTCGSSCFAGAAGCVATLLHDAAMNPAEGNGDPVRWGGWDLPEWDLPEWDLRGLLCDTCLAPLSLLLAQPQGSFEGHYRVNLGSPVGASGQVRGMLWGAQ